MEYIAILIAFLLGAYVRQPITFRYKVVEQAKPNVSKTSVKPSDQKEEKLTMQEQFDNLMKFTGKEQE